MILRLKGRQKKHMKLLSELCECADVCEEQSQAQSLRLLQGRCGHWPWCCVVASEWPALAQLSCVYISPVSVRQPRRQHHHHHSDHSDISQ